jgi:hypothetical protein
MLEDLGFTLVSLLVMITMAVCRPDRARCPSGTHNEGVRPSGAFECVRDLVGGENDSPGGESTAIEPHGKIAGQLYCTNGSQPIVVDYQTVGCQIGGWR